MTHSKNGKSPAIPKHPDQRPDELLASEIAALVGVARQTALKRQERHPERMNGRLLPALPHVSGGARGVWAFPRWAAEAWAVERAEAKRKARNIARLRKRGYRINGR